MNDTAVAGDLLLFAVLPYVAIVVAVIGTIERLRSHSYTLTSQSTQFLENRQHFWSVVPFHYGVLVVLLGHLVLFTAPRLVLAWDVSPVRLFALESIALAAGLLALGGFVGVVYRRASVPFVRAVTRPVDWAVYAVLLLQLGSGVVVAISSSWGSSWLAAVGTPYVWSLLRLRPDITVVSVLPAVAKLHIASAFLLLALFPFSRLVHIVSVPNSYLWRRPQVVRWYRRRAAPTEV